MGRALKHKIYCFDVNRWYTTLAEVLAALVGVDNSRCSWIVYCSVRQTDGPLLKSHSNDDDTRGGLFFNLFHTRRNFFV